MIASAVLTMMNVVNGHLKVDAWLRENLPNPLIFLVAGFFFYYLSGYIVDIPVFLYAMLFDREVLQAEWFNYEAHLLGFFVALSIVSGILFLMSRVPGGFLSAVAVIFMVGSFILYFLPDIFG